MPYTKVEDRREAWRRYYHAQPERREASHARKVRYRERNAAYVVGVKEGQPCMDCGRVFPHYAMDFDHVGDGDKILDICALVRTPVALRGSGGRDCEVRTGLCRMSPDSYLAASAVATEGSTPPGRPRCTLSGMSTDDLRTKRNAQRKAEAEAEATRDSTLPLQVVHADRAAAAEAAVAEAEAANITTPGAVMYSAPDGYGTGDGTTWP